ncbi:MAG: PAS domain S-box protein [Ignavibacteriaceae bacterium]|nr:PAS domain S-box protein [Ignavibacteriaceae bacterium]
MRLPFKLSPKAIISITLLIAAVMLISSYVELNQSKKEIFQLLYEHSSTLLESVIQSSKNTLNSSYEIEDLIANRLLDNAKMIKRLDAVKSLNKDELISIAKENDLYRINIFDSKGNRVLSNRIPEPGHIHGEENINRYEELSPILNGEVDELIIGLKSAEFTDEERFAVAVARSNNKGAIVVNINAENFLEFRKKIGIGVILQQMSKHHGIEYILLQDSIGVLAASEKIDSVESIISSGFLQTALKNDSVYARVTFNSGQEVYEVTKRFLLEDDLVGLYRLGVSLEDIRNVEDRMLRRLIIISLILAAISIIVLSIIFTTQNLKTISDEYKNFKTLTASVLENMSEAVIVLDDKNNITLFNKSAEKLFGLKTENVLQRNIRSIFNGVLDFLQTEILTNSLQSFEREITLNGEQKYFSFSISRLEDPDSKKIKSILVIKDLTDTKRLEDEAKKNEKLSAMGELASGVAHEIRNPINAIGMIAQRLNKEFSPKENSDEYFDITHLLKTEVNRINKIITQFLNYAKPLEISLKQIEINSYLKEIYRLFEEQAKQKSIKFILQGNEKLSLRIDADLIKQALMNIIQNAFDAVTADGEVVIKYFKLKNDLIIQISDNGVGIPTEQQRKIFDLYFTTKKDGNGLGLSISQKIISQHNGSITVSSKINKGTTFKIILPIL